MIYPHTELRLASAEKGHGVFALQNIPKGTITWVRDPLDHLITAEAVELLPLELRGALSHDYYRPFGGHYLLTHDNTRFMNHSCNPTCVHLFDDVEIAIRDIAAGEEMSSDYATFTLEKYEEFNCCCLEKNCRGWIRATDPSAQKAYWQPILEDAFQYALGVPQPLGFLFAQSSLKEIAALCTAIR
jgi:SET domain-containing protein